MLKFLRKTRQSLLSEGKTRKYINYAIGEIVLVVIGILIALQINNWNIKRNDRNREAKYQANIVLDLKKDLVRLDYLIEFRKSRLIGDKKLLQILNGAPIDNVTETTKNVVNSMMEENFSANNTTFLELSNSGNLNVISNDSIKFLLLELEALYKTNNLSIAHETFDYREYISKPVLKNVNIDQLFPIYLGTKTVEDQKISINTFDSLFENREYKNGLFIMSFMSNGYLTTYDTMKKKSQKIIDLIERENR